MIDKHEDSTYYSIIVYQKVSIHEYTLLTTMNVFQITEKCNNNKTMAIKNLKNTEKIYLSQS